jgi:hypothetical protein
MCPPCGEKRMITTFSNHENDCSVDFSGSHRFRRDDAGERPLSPPIAVVRGRTSARSFARTRVLVAKVLFIIPHGLADGGRDAIGERIAQSPRRSLVPEFREVHSTMTHDARREKRGVRARAPAGSQVRRHFRRGDARGEPGVTSWREKRRRQARSLGRARLVPVSLPVSLSVSTTFR